MTEKEQLPFNDWAPRYGMAVDWREIFIKYVEHIGNIEGTTFGAESGAFSEHVTPEETAAILRIKESEYLKYRQ